MAAPKLTDQEFIRLWNECNSSYKMAKVTGIASQNIQTRKRTIEKRHGILLKTIDSLGRPAYDQSMTVDSERVEIKIDISDGIVLVAGDQHYRPGHVPVCHRGFVHLAKKLKPKLCVWNGDSFDFPTISRHPQIGFENRPTVKAELEAVRDRSEEIIKASPNSKRVMCFGNHDLRFSSRLAAVAHEYRDVAGTDLMDHLPGWQAVWFITINGGKESHTEIRHREKSGVHAGYNNTKESGINIVTGHDHRAEVIAYDDRRGRRYSVRHGMTADSSSDPSFVQYLEGRKMNWQAGFAVLTYRNGVLLQPELALRYDGDSIQFRGEVIPV